MMNNYDRMLDAARRRFLEYDLSELSRRPGVTDEGECLATCFLGHRTLIRKADGAVFLDGRPAKFEEGLCVYDWLCDRRPQASASGELCPVSSLPGVYVRGSGLSMDMEALARRIHCCPEAFCEACARLGGKALPLGDLGFRLEVFPGLPAGLKFYFGDEEFLPRLTLLWDKNILCFVRYETVYYIAGCLERRLADLMA